MAVFPDRIVLKTSGDTESSIIQQIQPGGSDEIALGEIVLGLTLNDVKFFTRNANNQIVTLGATGNSIGDFSDVTLSPLVVNDILYYDGSTFVNGSINLDALGDVASAGAVSGEVLKYNGSGWVPSNINISELTNVDVTTNAPTVNQALVWNGNNWVPDDQAGGSGAGGVIAGTILQKTESQTAASGVATYTDLGASGQLVEVTSDLAAWVVLYATAADRTADSGRAYGAATTPGDGVLAEFTVGAGSTVVASPGTTYFNNDTVETEAIYAAIRDTSGNNIAATVDIKAYVNQTFGGAGTTRVTDGGTASTGLLTLTGLGQSGIFVSVESDLAAWIVFYGSAADRAADSSRTFGTDPSPGSGVFAEFAPTAGQILTASPGMTYHNRDTNPSEAIYLAVRDTSGNNVNATVTVKAYAQTAVGLGGATVLNELLDVNTATITPSQNSLLVYDAASLEFRVGSISGGTGLTTTGNGNISIDLDDTAVTPGTYTFPSVTVDQQGRITSISENPIERTIEVNGYAIAGSNTNGGGLGSDDIHLHPRFNSAVNIRPATFGSNGRMKIRLYDSDTAVEYIQIQTPRLSEFSTYTLTLPFNDGDPDQVLTTDGSGNLSWTSGVATANIGDLSNVDTATNPPAAGDVLVYQSPNWEPVTLGLDDLSGVDLTTTAPVANDVLKYDGINWVPGVGGGGGGGGGSAIAGTVLRVSETQTAVSGAATYTGLSSSGTFVDATSDLDAWIVFYATAADRTADASRPYGTDPSVGSGVLAEFYVAAGTTVTASPGTTYFNNDTVAADAIYASVRDQSGNNVAATVTIKAYAHQSFAGVGTNRVTDSGTSSSGLLALNGIGQTGLFCSVTSSANAWIVAYGSSAARTSDAGRSFGSDPTPGSGVLAEFNITTPGATVLATPGTTYWNDDTEPTNTIYFAVRDTSGNNVISDITVVAYAETSFSGVSGGTFGSG